jgi:signal transduction histidine kinase
MSPVAALRLQLDVLEEECRATAKASGQEILRSMRRSTFWVQKLVEDLVLSSTGDAGSVRVRLRPVGLRECIEEATSLLQPDMARKNSQVRVSCPQDLPTVDGDEHLIKRVILNLLANAMKYGPPGDVIQVDVSAGMGYLRVCVTDHGAGIPLAERERVFGMYVRGEEALRKHPRGLGLGLWIVKSLVERHGGVVGIDGAPGEGASVWFTLPAARTARTKAEDHPPLRGVEGDSHLALGGVQ